MKIKEVNKKIIPLENKISFDFRLPPSHNIIIQRKLKEEKSCTNIQFK